MRWINKTWQTHTDTHTKTRPKNLQTLHTFLGSRFKILGETSWIQALTVIQGPMSVSAWIQEVFPTILNLESQKFANFASFPGFKIQDSGRNFLNLSADCHPGPHVSQRLDSRSFSQNLESWIPKIRKLCKLSWIQASRFKNSGRNFLNPGLDCHSSTLPAFCGQKRSEFGFPFFSSQLCQVEDCFGQQVCRV